MNFKHMTFLCMQQLTNFPYIEEDFDALTNYELLCKVVEYLNEVIKNENLQNDAINTLATNFNNLKDYVDNYFDNLDVQDEINNKLDEMLEDGTLENIIKQYFEIETPEKYGAIGDGINDDTQAWQDAIDYCSTNHKTLFGRSGKTYLVDTLTINSDINIDGNYCTLKSNGDNVINIEYTDLGSNFIKNLNIIDVPANKIGIYCNPARRYTLENITMTNISGTGIKVATYGGGILVKNYKITGNTSDVQTVGLDVRGTSDGTYKDITMIDMFIGVYANGGNFFKNVHPWLATASIFNGSKAFVITGGQIMLDNCYPDTYMYNYYISNNAYVNLNQCRQYHNINVANNNTIENAGGKTYAFYYDNQDTSKNTFIHNSIFQNATSEGVKYAYQTNLEKPLYNIDRTTQWIGMVDGQGKKYVELTFVPANGISVYEEHSNFNNNICWYNLRFLVGPHEANTEFDLGFIDTKFLPPNVVTTIAYTGNGSFQINGYALVRIQANGKMTAKLQETTSNNLCQLVVNVAFFATQQS